MSILLFDARHSKGRRKLIKDGAIYVNERLVQCSMRPCQEHVYRHYKNEQLFIPCEPPGSGKSTMVKFVAAEALSKDPTRRVIISVPDLDIGRTFRKVVLDYGNKQLHWDVDPSFDLCGGSGNGSKIDRVVQFIQSDPSPTPYRRVLLCTHSSLTAACSRLRTNTDFRNIWFILDEAHHSQYDDFDNLAEMLANRLGKLLHRLIGLAEKDKSIRIWLPTATFFRGDQLAILPERLLRKFANYYLPLDEHWEQNIRHIEGYSYYFVPYKGKVWPEVREILSKSKIPTIIFCPAVNHALAEGCKYSFTTDLKREIRKVWPEARIVDLVDEKNRAKNREILERDSSSVDIILSLRVFDEGSDWEDAAQVLDLVGTGSLRVAVQRFGRLLRDKKHKKHIAYYRFVPFVLDSLNPDDYRNTLSQAWAAMAASMVLEDYIRPVKIPKPKQKTSKGTGFELVNYFRMEVPNEMDQQKIWDDLTRELVCLRDQAGKNPSKKLVQETIIQILSDHGIERHKEEICCQIAALLRRRAIKQYGVDVAELVRNGFDKIWTHKIFDLLLSYGTGITNRKSFSELRRLFSKSNFLSYEELQRRVQEMDVVQDADGNVDILATVRLYRRKYPEAQSA